jgi:hypothetical protein
MATRNCTGEDGKMRPYSQGSADRHDNETLAPVEDVSFTGTEE